MTQPDPFQPYPDHDEIVELIGGPCDGDKVGWSKGMTRGESRWLHGVAVYCWEGPGKAVFSYTKLYLP